MFQFPLGKVNYISVHLLPCHCVTMIVIHLSIWLSLEVDIKGNNILHLSILIVLCIYINNLKLYIYTCILYINNLTFSWNDLVPHILHPPGVGFLSRKHPFIIWVREVLFEWLVPGHIHGMQFWSESSLCQNVCVESTMDQILYFIASVAPELNPHRQPPLCVVSAPDSVQIHPVLSSVTQLLPVPHM